MNLIGIVAALPAEGVVFRNAWGLKAVKEAGPFRCYGDGDKILVISGVGRVRCAAAVAWLIARYPAIVDGVLLNAGVAGSKARETGSVHLIHQAVDAATGKRFYPDILFSHTYGEATLHTVDRPMDALAEGMDEADLIDMEGTGFLQAAQLWIPCHRAHLVKVVADNLTPDKVDRDTLTRFMENTLPAVDHVTGTVSQSGKPGDMEERMQVLGEMGERWRLTMSQRAQINRAGRAWLLRHPDGHFALPNDIETPRDKQSRSRALAALLDRLWEA